MSVAHEDLLAPDDLDALAVHADALIERGHFLGEVIAAQLALHDVMGPHADPAQRTRLASEARALLMKNASAIFGDLASHVVSVVPKSPNEPTGQYAACTASWRLGVIDEVALVASKKMAPVEMLDALAKTPFARYLRSIVLGAAATAAQGRAPPLISYVRVVETLVRHATSFPRLRALFFGDLGEGQLAGRVGSLARLYEALPDLEILRVHSNDVVLGKIIGFAKLRVLEVVGNAATLETLDRVRASSLDELTSVTFDPTRYAAGATGAFREALECVRDLPKLERLALRNFSGNDKIASLLAWKGLARLTELDLSYCDLNDEMKILADNFDRFTHLEKLDLRFNNLTLSPTLYTQLRELLPRANFAGQTAMRR